MPKVTGRVQPAERVKLDELSLCSAFEGVGFPAPRWLLLAYADYNGAGYQLRSALLRLPERIYRGVVDVACEVNGPFGATCGPQPQPSHRTDCSPDGRGRCGRRIAGHRGGRT
jgi:hypothetical protein